MTLPEAAGSRASSFASARAERLDALDRDRGDADAKLLRSLAAFDDVDRVGDAGGPELFSYAEDVDVEPLGSAPERAQELLLVDPTAGGVGDALGRVFEPLTREEEENVIVRSAAEVEPRRAVDEMDLNVLFVPRDLKLEARATKVDRWRRLLFGGDRRRIRYEEGRGKSPALVEPRDRRRRRAARIGAERAGAFLGWLSDERTGSFTTSADGMGRTFPYEIPNLRQKQPASYAYLSLAFGAGFRPTPSWRLGVGLDVTGFTALRQPKWDGECSACRFVGRDGESWFTTRAIAGRFVMLVSPFVDARFDF